MARYPRLQTAGCGVHSLLPPQVTQCMHQGVCCRSTTRPPNNASVGRKLEWLPRGSLRERYTAFYALDVRGITDDLLAGTQHDRCRMSLPFLE